MENEILESLVEYVTQQFALDIIARANITQLNIDKYLRKQGINLSDERIIQLVESGQTSAINEELRAFRNAVNRYLGDSVTVAGQTGIEQYHTETSNDSDMYEWVTTSDKTCPDCESRDGMVETYETWRDILGLPVSGFSLCGSRCRCLIRKV